MTTRPLLASTAAATALLLGTAAGSPALASTGAAPAKGAAGSALSLLQVTAGGHQLALGGLTMTSDTVSGTPLASITLTPVTADGTAYGQQVITPSNSPVTVPATSSPSALAGFAALSSPSFATTATSVPATHVGSTSLGSLSLLGIAVPLTGSVDVGSSVSGTEGALASKSVTLKNLSLPSIAAILGALGLDLSALPVGTLPSLVEQLGLATGAITTAQAAVDTAQAAVDTATATLAANQALLTSAQDTLTTAQATLEAALAALAVPITLTDLLALSQVARDAFDAANPAVGTADAAFVAATAAVAAAQALVDTAQAALTTLLATLSGLVATLASLASTVLDGTPLVSLGSLSVSSRALVITAKAGGQFAQVLGGTITGLKVLGTDVLQSALGSSSLDVVDLVGTAAANVTSTINGLTGTLSSVLSTVPGLPTLSIPAPQVKLLTRSTSTSIAGGFGHALSSVQGLQITLPSITMPSAVALPGAASLPAFAGITQTGTDLTSGPVSVGALTLSDNAAFRPAVLASTPTTPITPTTPTAGLPNTGLPVGVAVLSLVLLGGALVLRRRRSTDS